MGERAERLKHILEISNTSSHDLIGTSHDKGTGHRHDTSLITNKNYVNSFNSLLHKKYELDNHGIRKTSSASTRIDMIKEKVVGKCDLSHSAMISFATNIFLMIFEAHVHPQPITF